MGQSFSVSLLLLNSESKNIRNISILEKIQSLKMMYGFKEHMDYLAIYIKLNNYRFLSKKNRKPKKFIKLILPYQ